ncbi:uncharacterized protein EDB91DRAFT_1042622 [Suillus paluster]|uniref:uncharacterized protein n=1 Tax=Suillus paluster TaxID=48578 RepID=UPI001B872D7A|nr:uncharacterized protein EDB91DRAFT_1042622 [Suillus paluster]KAG1754856.1 hypothetical protein EDB91DRAFT_1042622 [Suillus paluster]
MGPELTGGNHTAFDVLKSELSQKTNAAASEGQRDLRMAKDTSASYLDQAKTMVESVVTSAQEYLHGSTDPQATANQLIGSSTGIATPAPSKAEGGVISSLQTSASSAVGTAQQYLASAQAAAQPHIDRAQTSLQPQVDKARETVEGYFGTHSSTLPSDAVTPPMESTARPTTDMPLNGEDVAGTPYVSATTTPGADEKKLESNVA